MSMLKEFREFAIKGNVVDLAVGVIIGAAFGKIVDSLVKDLIMPVVGRVFGGLDFTNLLHHARPALRRVHRADDLRRADQGRRAAFRLRQLHHGRDQFRHSGVHHFSGWSESSPR